MTNDKPSISVNLVTAILLFAYSVGCVLALVLSIFG